MEQFSRRSRSRYRGRRSASGRRARGVAPTWASGSIPSAPEARDGSAGGLGHEQPPRADPPNGGACRRGAARRWRPTAVSRPGTRDRADRDIEPRAGVLMEADAVQPDPALGVLGPPVMPNHPPPAAQLDDGAGLGARQLEHSPSKRAAGSGARELRARQGGPIDPGLREMSYLRLGRRDPSDQRAPRRYPRRGRDPAGRLAQGDPAAGGDAGPRWSSCACTAPPGAGSKRVNHTEPRGGRPGGLVDRAADPQPRGSSGETARR